jgi:hypothetical protein
MATGSVSWDCSTNRPIIDGKTINPDTGEVQPASIPITYGPPTIDIVYHNFLGYDPEDDVWKLVRGPTGPSIDQVFIRVAKLVQAGVITLHSVNITQYTCVVVCESKATKAEFRKAAWDGGMDDVVLGESSAT